MLLLTFADYRAPGERLAAALGVPFAPVDLHRFPDGESRVRLPTDLPAHVVLCRSLNQPNDKLVELLLCAQTARELGARRLTLVAPYLCYMRQDIANRPGEGVSQRIVGRWLADWFDDVITVDPHLHRIARLEQAIPLKNAIAVSAGVTMGRFLRSQFDDAVLLGPDAESEQWVAEIAGDAGFEFAVASKIRGGDRDVRITLPDYDFNGRRVVMVDDMASTGRTLACTVALLRQAGAGDICAAITHPLFCGDAEACIRAAGICDIWSTDSIEHASSCIRLAGLLSEAVKALTSAAG